MSRTQGVGDPRMRVLVLGRPFMCGPTPAGRGCGQLVPPGHCHLCHRPGATTVDHLLPVVLGGVTTLGNLRPAHHGCNSGRGARMDPPPATIVVPW